MTVYVDDMKANFGRMKMCHMVADTLDELHAMAERIGVCRRWFQGDSSWPHYDIALSKRKLAVEAGARALTLRQLGMMVHEWRKNAAASRLPVVEAALRIECP